jgi:putative heme iron utilization protein
MTDARAAAPLPGAMPGRVPENAPQPADFDPLTVARTLLRTTRAGTLATLDRNTGHPFASLVNVATDCDGSPLILVSRLATHTANLERDRRASVLLAVGGKGDPLAHPRLTVLGTMNPTQDEGARRRFLARHPKSALYAGFADFSFWRMDVASAHLNGGFARAADLTRAQLMTQIGDAEALLAAEADAIAHMNSDHADAVRLYAAKLLGEADGDWRIVGIDPDGLDLALGDRIARLAFCERVLTPDMLRRVLKDLAERARTAD